MPPRLQRGAAARQNAQSQAEPGAVQPGQATQDALALSAKEFSDLADVPPEIEWFANLTNPQTRRAYQSDLKDCMRCKRSGGRSQ